MQTGMQVFLLPLVAHWTFAGASEGSVFLAASCYNQVKVSDLQPQRPYLEKTHHRKGLVEWLKV
jgi:hypothetical protein